MAVGYNRKFSHLGLLRVRSSSRETESPDELAAGIKSQGGVLRVCHATRGISPDCRAKETLGGGRRLGTCGRAQKTSPGVLP